MCLRIVFTNLVEPRAIPHRPGGRHAFPGTSATIVRLLPPSSDAHADARLLAPSARSRVERSSCSAAGIAFRERASPKSLNLGLAELEQVETQRFDLGEDTEY